MDRLYLVVPCYNEEEVLPETVRRLTDKLRRMEEKGLVSGDSPDSVGGRRQPGQLLGADLRFSPGESGGIRFKAVPQPGASKCAGCPDS